MTHLLVSLWMTLLGPSFDGQILAPILFGQAPGGSSWGATPVLQYTGGSVSATAGSPSLATSAFGSALTAGSIILAGVSNAVSTGSFTVTDTAGNTYADAGFGVLGSSSPGLWVELFCANNTHTTSSNVVTMTANTSTNYPRITAVEINNGHATCSSIDKNSGQIIYLSSPAPPNNMTSGAQTTTTNGQFIWGWVGAYNGSATVTAGSSPNAFTLLGCYAMGNCSEWFVQSTAGSIAAIASDSATGDSYFDMMVTIKP